MYYLPLLAGLSVTEDIIDPVIKLLAIAALVPIAVVFSIGAIIMAVLYFKNREGK